MAGDWIKMRVDLQTHPKIVRILSATKADKFRVIGGLHAVWSVFDTHSVDGVLNGYTPETLDHIIGWAGFSEAVIAVGWLVFDGAETLTLPEFDEHNGKSGKRRAEDQKRKRLSRNCPHDVPQNVTQECGQNADKMRTREEKRREEKKEKKERAADLLIGIPEQLSKDFLKIRAVKKAPLTQTALDGLKREAGKAGLTLEAAITLCCERGWSSLKADWPAVQELKQKRPADETSSPASRRPLT